MKRLIALLLTLAVLICLSPLALADDIIIVDDEEEAAPAPTVSVPQQTQEETVDPNAGYQEKIDALEKKYDQLEEQQKALSEKEFTAKAGGGAVEVTVTGQKMLKSIQISPDAVDPEDVEMLQDMILAAVNEALGQVDDEMQSMMGGMTGGLAGLGF